MIARASDLMTPAGFTLPLVGEDHPLRKNFHRTFARSAIFAMLIHGAVAGGRFRADSHFENPAREKVYTIVKSHPISPPRLSDGDVSPKVNLAEQVSQPKVAGIELVPDYLSEDLNVAAVDGTAETANPDGSVPTGDGNSFLVGADEGTVDGPGYEAVEMYPALIYLPRPDYPPMARTAGVEGVVMLQLLVGEDGKVKEVRVLEGPEMLREAAVAAATQARFKPAQNQHRPVAAWVQVPMKFVLRT